MICEYCNGTGEIETDNNGPIGWCPVCWRPIDSAPKDGTWVELMNEHNGLTDVGQWCDYTRRGSLAGLPGEWNQELGNGDMTHWRPRMRQEEA